MTGGSDSQSTDSAFHYSDDDRAALRRRALRFDQILAGALPSTEELITGLPPCSDDLQADVMAFLDVWKVGRLGEIDLDLAVSIELARANAHIDTLATLQARAQATGVYQDGQLADRADVWLAYRGNAAAKARCVLAAIRPRGGARGGLVDSVFRAAFAVGITSRRENWECAFGDADKVLVDGITHLGAIAPMIIALEGAVEVHHDQQETGLKKLIAKLSSSEDEEAGQGDAQARPSDLLGDHDDGDPGLVVVPKMPVGTGGQKDTRKSWSDMAGKPLPIVQRGDVARHRRELVARWPHAADVIDIILGDLAAREQVRFRPTLLLGSPGSGKSSLARAICDQLGLPHELTSLAGLSDSSAMGTSAQWSTARESTPLQLIKRSKMASVGVIWDEIEKAGDGRHNGNALDALLPMLEVDQARKFRDLALEVEVDLSMVSHFATANAIDGLSAPVRDRFRVLQIPDPGLQHLGVLSRQIVGRIAGERGIDARWFAPLAEDELDLVRDVWTGGSIRKLTTIVRTIIDGRDRMSGRC
jgi:hypothetical protein